jgi:hypothetical protein
MPTTVPATADAVAHVLDVASARVLAAEGSDGPADYENAGAGARFAASELDSFIYPKPTQPAAAALVVALRKISVDSADAAPSSADLSALTQTFRSDLYTVDVDANALIDNLG